jgi:hypothetical protein
MKKELTKKEELGSFLAQHCEIKYAQSATSGDRAKIYMFHTQDCVLFMAEAYIHGMRTAIGQNESVMEAAKKSGDFSKVVMVYNWSAPEPGMDVVQIPETLVSSLNKDQAAVFLRNLQRIQKDIDVGKARKETLQKLFGNKAVINVTYALDGERQFCITGAASPADRRSYAERYAEQAATNILFDLPKALNESLQVFLPEYARGAHFVEGRSTFHKKMRYGIAEAHTELLLTEEGAEIFTALAKDSPQEGVRISKLFQQAIMDPVGLSLKYYMGKRAMIKLPSKSEE